MCRIETLHWITVEVAKMVRADHENTKLHLLLTALVKECKRRKDA